jgi:hypothetical protein
MATKPQQAASTRRVAAVSSIVGTPYLGPVFQVSEVIGRGVVCINALVGGISILFAINALILHISDAKHLSTRYAQVKDCNQVVSNFLIDEMKTSAGMDPTVADYTDPSVPKTARQVLQDNADANFVCGERGCKTGMEQYCNMCINGCSAIVYLADKGVKPTKVRPEGEATGDGIDTTWLLTDDENPKSVVVYGVFGMNDIIEGYVDDRNGNFYVGSLDERLERTKSIILTDMISAFAGIMIAWYVRERVTSPSVQIALGVVGLATLVSAAKGHMNLPI